MIAHGRTVLSQDFLSVLYDDAFVFLANADAHEVVGRAVCVAVGVHLVDAILTAGDDDGLVVDGVPISTGYISYPFISVSHNLYMQLE